MNELTTLDAGLTMTSLEIAALTDKRHDNVLADARKMLVELHGEGGLLKFEDTHQNPQNGQDYPMFRLPKRETLILVSGYSLLMRARIIDRWQDLERQAAMGAWSASIPKTLPEALRLAAEAMEGKAIAEARVQSLESTVATQAPKVDGFERIAGAEGSLCLRDAAKALQVRPCDLKSQLIAKHWIYGRPGHGGWLAYQDKIQQGLLVHKVTTIQTDDDSARVVEQVRVTPKGLTRLAELMQEKAA